MGTVFVLLSVLVGIIHAMSALTGALAGEATAVPEETGVDEEIVAVIGAAIGRYRHTRAR